MKAILFDLDGTLLPIDVQLFTDEYFRILTEKVGNEEEAKKLCKVIWDSTQYMIDTIDENKTNEDCFFEHFNTKIEKVEEATDILNHFYLNEYTGLKSICKPNPLARDIIKIVKDKGYELVIATNPLFPKEGINRRVEWAGLDVEDFKLITTYENMHYCKPHLKYYEEILSIIDRKPEEVMMVGNDVQEDLVVSELGIKTFLLEDYKISREGKIYEPDYKGSYKELYEFVKELPKL
ncbi:haloacid dehalogenase domain protein hydrolase [Gottschalkia purinilytica]|uniref:Haloacid dehalogenase domain protein hydrolase n=1 Tax=Gottschalkia purinilytica TaxID=1503 RepID=A0A0L0WD09_GOTPU|nr:HAD family hydrolase [Gottschalkia purinilytica]KNF09331.1 haloacid dehalogenase domain protein hydrolase [Gottschalkia purinilytica]